MTSSITWLDHDSAANNRSLRLLQLFKAADSRDELGIGGVRDSIADQLFPGTSTIQTRLRYVFFIPWLYSSLEQQGVPTAGFPARAREAELRLLAELNRNEPPGVPGVIGRDAGSGLKRLPSSVYWTALGAWGLRSHGVSLQQYFAVADRLSARCHMRGEVDSESDEQASFWHAQLAKLRPVGFPAGARLALTKSEAEFMLDCWRRTQPKSLLSWLALDATHGHSPARCDQIWAHPRFEEFPMSFQTLIHHSRRFDSLIHGAALLYNLQLAELERNESLVSEHSGAMSSWVDQELEDLRKWNLNELWPQVVGKGHTVTPATRLFTEAWHGVLLSESNKPLLSRSARELVRGREQALKGSRSRFINHASRRAWGGNAGLVRLSYRWPIAQSFLAEWYEGFKS